MSFGMFFLVIAAGGLSAAIFYFEGSQAAVYAQIAVVPLLIIVGYLWVNQTVQSTGTSRTEFERRKARQLGEQFTDTWQLAQQIESEYSDGITDTEWQKLESHIEQLQSNGISFDRSTGSFDISTRNLGSLEDINQVESEIEQLDNWLLKQFTENVRSRVAEINSNLNRLNALVSDPQTVDPEEVPDAGAKKKTTQSWRATGNKLKSSYDTADKILENATAAIQDALNSTDNTTDPQVEQLLSSAREAGAARKYGDAITDILDARDAVERDATTTFDEQREAIDRLLRTAQRKPIKQYVGPTYHETLENQANELASLDDAIEIVELRQVREEIRQTCLEIVEELQDQLRDTINTLDNANIPEGWYERPSTVNENLVRSLQSTSDIEAFHDEFDTSVDSLLSALKTVKPKASVVTGYSRVEPQITEALRADGVATGSDIPVSELEDQFLGLYYRRHMDEVEFDPDETRLLAAHGNENYTIQVSATFPTGGEEREVTITLSGPTTQKSVCRTPLVAETTFENVSYGEYTVRAEPTGGSYATTEQTIMVDNDQTISFELKEISIREQLCDDTDIDVDEILDTISSRFKTKFDETGYLSTEMTFPVDDEYIPCLLAVWSQRQGYDVARYNSNIVIYDENLLQKEIENVIQYNIEPGDSKTYDALRNGFLSAPIPDNIVKELVGDSSEQGAVKIESTRITKQEES